MPLIVFFFWYNIPYHLLLLPFISFFLLLFHSSFLTFHPSFFTYFSHIFQRAVTKDNTTWNPSSSANINIVIPSAVTLQTFLSNWKNGIQPSYQSHMSSATNLTSVFHSSISSTPVSSGKVSTRGDEISSAYSETDTVERNRIGNESQMFPDVVSATLTSVDSISHRHAQYSKVRKLFIVILSKSWDFYYIDLCDSFP